MISKSRLGDLVREVDPCSQLDEEVEEALLNIADDFIESCVNASCKLAKHRGSRTLDVRDLHIYLGELSSCFLIDFFLAVDYHFINLLYNEM